MNGINGMKTNNSLNNLIVNNGTTTHNGTIKGINKKIVEKINQKMSSSNDHNSIGSADNEVEVVDLSLDAAPKPTSDPTHSTDGVKAEHMGSEAPVGANGAPSISLKYVTTSRFEESKEIGESIKNIDLQIEDLKKKVKEIENANYTPTPSREVNNEFSNASSEKKELVSTINELNAYRYSLKQYQKVEPYEKYRNEVDYEELSSINVDNDTYNGREFNRLMNYYGKYLTDDQKKTFKYLYNKFNDDTWKYYCGAIQDQLNKSRGLEQALKLLKDYGNNPDAIEEIAQLFSMFGQGVGDGVTSFGEGLTGWFDGNDVMSVNAYKMSYISEILSSSKVGQEIESQLGKIEINQDELKGALDRKDLFYSYNTGTAVGNMAPTVLTGAVVTAVTGGAAAPAAVAAGEAASSTLMFFTAAGSARKQAMVEGNDPAKSTLYGIAVGAFEAVSERYLGTLPFLSKGGSKIADNGMIKSVLTGLKDIAQEGGQEVLQNIGEAYVDNTLLGKPFDINQLVNDSTDSFVIGCLTAGLLNGGIISVQKAGQVVNISMSQLGVKAEDIIGQYKNGNKEGINKLKRSLQSFVNGNNANALANDPRYQSNYKVEQLNKTIGEKSDKLTLDDLSYNKNNSIIYTRDLLKSNLNKYIYKNTNEVAGVNEKIRKDGLYHFTNNSDKIINSGYIKSSNHVASYGNKKTFFFSGIPSVGEFATNLDSLPIAVTAVKVQPTEDVINSEKMKIRIRDDQAITYDGNFSLDGQNATVEYFCLKKIDNKLSYFKVDKATFDNYKNTDEGKKMQDFVNDKKNIKAITSDFYDMMGKRNKEKNNSTVIANASRYQTASVEFLQELQSNKIRELSQMRKEYEKVINDYKALRDDDTIIRQAAYYTGKKYNYSETQINRIIQRVVNREINYITSDNGCRQNVINYFNVLDTYLNAMNRLNSKYLTISNELKNIDQQLQKAV